jgi:hypothetical protein
MRSVLRELREDRPRRQYRPTTERELLLMRELPECGYTFSAVARYLGRDLKHVIRVHSGEIKTSAADTDYRIEVRRRRECTA